MKDGVAVLVLITIELTFTLKGKDKQASRCDSSWTAKDRENNPFDGDCSKRLHRSTV
jgi:hypothetical protein